MLANSISPAEYLPYYKQYIELVNVMPLLDALAAGMETTQNFFENLPEEIWDYRYAPGKWTPKDILQHIADTERVFAYRALYFARDKKVDIKGFDENIFAENAFAEKKSVSELLQNYVAVRNASLSLFSGFDERELKQIGMGNGSAMSVRAAGFIICGHEKHHCNIILERYLRNV